MTAPDSGRVARPAILTVDDDPSVSRAVARDLRRQYGEGYRIVRAESGPQALDALREIKLRGEQVAVLLADYRMPAMSGIEFLEQAMDLFPLARRVLLTAYADTDAAIQAINVVDLDHYLLKPWDPPEEKLYPVVDALLDAWTASDRQPPRGDPGGRAPLVGPSYEVRDFLARNLVPYRWYLADDPEGAAAAGRGRRRAPTSCRWWSPPTAPRWSSRPTPSWPSTVGLATNPGHRLLRPDHRRRRPGRARRGRVRRVRGPADGAGRAAGDRRAGRAEQPDRELPRLPGRRVRRAADRAGPPAGGQVRRRGAHRPRGRRPGAARHGPGGALRRRRRDRRRTR